jgi:hypothetical protein
VNILENKTFLEELGKRLNSSRFSKPTDFFPAKVRIRFLKTFFLLLQMFK